MCECGCTSNDRLYTLPAPGEAYYLVTLRGHCVECDGPSGVIIELLAPGSHDHGYYMEPDAVNGPLPLHDWGDKKGVTIATGMTKDEFVKKLSPQLIGLDSDEMGEDGALDAVGAEVVLDEMYEDAQTFPAIIE